MSDLSCVDGCAHSADTACWKPPIPLQSFQAPSFPTETLTPWLRDFVEAESIATQTPPDLAAMLCLAAVAAAVAKRVHLRIREGWAEPLNLYTVSVLPSGSRKSAVFRDVIAPISNAEWQAVRDQRTAVASAQEEKRLLELRLRGTEKAISKGEADQQEAVSLAAEVANFEIPPLPRLLADDVTPERLEVLLAEHGGRMALFAPEGDIFDIISGRYSRPGANLGVFLKGHSGDDLRVDRVGRETILVREPALTMGLAVQPNVIENLAGPQFRGRGLTPRFLYSLPESNIGRRDINPPAVPRAITSGYAANLHQLICIEPRTDTNGNQRPHDLKYGSAAQVVLGSFAAWVESQLLPSGDLASIIEWGSKLTGAMARISGLLHMADNATEQAPWAINVSSETVERAVQIGHYLIPHAQAAFTAMGEDGVIADAQYALGRIEAKGLQAFTKRELFNLTRGRFKTVPAMQPGLDRLQQHGFIRLTNGNHRHGPGRPPSPQYEVHPNTGPHKTHNSQKAD